MRYLRAQQKVPVALFECRLDALSASGTVTRRNISYIIRAPLAGEASHIEDVGYVRVLLCQPLAASLEVSSGHEHGNTACVPCRGVIVAKSTVINKSDCNTKRQIYKIHLHFMHSHL